MILSASYTTKEGNPKSQYINLNLISSYSDCEGKKEQEGYQTVMYTQNGHALYTTLTPEEITLAIQGGVMTEQSVRSHLETLMQQQEDSGEEPEAVTEQS